MFLNQEKYSITTQKIFNKLFRTQDSEKVSLYLETSEFNVISSLKNHL